MGKQISTHINALNANGKLHHSTNQDVILVTVVWNGCFARSPSTKTRTKASSHAIHTSTICLCIQTQRCICSAFWGRTSASPFHASISFWRMNIFCASPPPNTTATILYKSNCFIVYNHWLATTILKGGAIRTSLKISFGLFTKAIS